MKMINGNQIILKWKKDNLISKKILRRLDYLAEAGAFCTLRNEKKFHVIPAAYYFSYAQLVRSCWFTIKNIILKVSTCFTVQVRAAHKLLGNF